VEGDDHQRQAFGALALAQAAAFTGDERSAAVAGQAILALLGATRVDPADPACRVPTTPQGRGEAFAAVLALAIYDLPGADERLIGEAERLCNHIRKQQHLFEPVVGDSGLLLSAVVAGNKVRPDAWKVEFAAKVLATNRAAYRSIRDPDHVANLIAAFARNPTWAGGFRGAQPDKAGPTFDSALCLAALGWAYQVTARNADVARAERYRQAAQDAALFVTSLQYTEPNTRHFENTFRANVLIGGFHLSPSDGDLRVDATGRGVSGLLRYLASGAER
jgi:hypothetical protein